MTRHAQLDRDSMAPGAFPWAHSETLDDAPTRCRRCGGLWRTASDGLICRGCGRVWLVAAMLRATLSTPRAGELVGHRIAPPSRKSTP